MCDFSKRSQTEDYLTSVVRKVQNTKIKSVFSFDPLSWSHIEGVREYCVCDTIYILFEDEMALVIDYLFIDELNLQYRSLSEQEKERYVVLENKDWFNCTLEISDYRTEQCCRTEECSLVYGCIIGFSLRGITREYLKWVHIAERSAPALEEVVASMETFDEIELVMDNGNRLWIRPDEADSDGYVRFWSDGVKEKIKEKG